MTYVENVQGTMAEVRQALAKAPTASAISNRKHIQSIAGRGKEELAEDVYALKAHVNHLINDNVRSCRPAGAGRRSRPAHVVRTPPTCAEEAQVRQERIDRRAPSIAASKPVILPVQVPGFQPSRQSHLRPGLAGSWPAPTAPLSRHVWHAARSSRATRYRAQLETAGSGLPQGVRRLPLLWS